MSLVTRGRFRALALKSWKTRRESAVCSSRIRAGGAFPRLLTRTRREFPQAKERRVARMEVPERRVANPYVFIVGCPRSGTTLPQRMLDAHPKIAMTPEESH